MTNLDKFLGGFTKILHDQWPEDIQLKVEGSDKASGILVHKLALAARSEVFKKMFESDEFKACDGVETVTLSEMEREELEAFVEFIYSNGSFSSPKLKQHVKSLYIAADKYEILHLRDVCRKEMISFMNTSNTLEVLEISQIPLDKLVKEAALEFITKNLRVISSLSEFKLFVGRNPDLIVEIMKTIFVFSDKCQRI